MTHTTRVAGRSLLPASAADLFFAAAIAGRFFTRDQTACEKVMSANGERINTTAWATEMTRREWRASVNTIRKKTPIRTAMKAVLPTTAIKAGAVKGP